MVNMHKKISKKLVLMMKRRITIDKKAKKE